MLATPSAGDPWPLAPGSPGHWPLPLAGVLHAAGALADALLPSQTAATCRQVAAPKLATWLDRLAPALACHPVGHAVAFSSVAAAFGSVAQGNCAFFCSTALLYLPPYHFRSSVLDVNSSLRLFRSTHEALRLDRIA